MALAKEIYKITAGFPAEEKFGLVSQMRRAAVSIPSNIAEGQARNTTGEFVQFISYAEGSLAELDTQLALAVELNFLPPEKARPVHGFNRRIAPDVERTSPGDRRSEVLLLVTHNLSLITMKNEITLQTRREFLRRTVLGSALSWTVPAFLANTFSALQARPPIPPRKLPPARTRQFSSSCKWPAAMTASTPSCLIQMIFTTRRARGSA